MDRNERARRLAGQEQRPALKGELGKDHVGPLNMASSHPDLPSMFPENRRLTPGMMVGGITAKFLAGLLVFAVMAAIGIGLECRQPNY